MTDPTPLQSMADVVDVEFIRGENAKDAAPTLLVEVPHGADLRRHYDALRARMKGELPDDLHAFFHVNTDVGAYAYGRAVAEAVVAADPGRAAVVVRSLIPRTFIDCNRPATSGDGDLTKGGLTAGIPSYMTDADDLALLNTLHKRYVDVAAAAYAAVCGDAAGIALVPHTYGPRTMGIKAIDKDIVKRLRWACEPEREATWPLRAEIDLLTRDGDKRELSPPGVEARLLADFQAHGFGVKANDTYYIHESSLAHTWSTTYPGQLICLEVRRDLLVPQWLPFEETIADAQKVARVAAVLTPVVLETLPRG
jgi:predicted N-formylglutamate amidohydrolase